MKKLVVFLLCAIIASTCSLSALATEEVQTCSEETEIIEFFYEEEISDELKERIENHLLNGGNRESRGILCTIFGHDLITSNTTQITHKVNASAPRCLEEKYKVETCEDCDYVNSTLLQRTYIYCCA